MTTLCASQLEVTLSQPKDAKVIIDLSDKSVDCGVEGLVHACIYVPGWFAGSLLLSFRLIRYSPNKVFI